METVIRAMSSVSNVAMRLCNELLYVYLQCCDDISHVTASFGKDLYK